MYPVPLIDPNLFSHQHCPKHSLIPWLENLWNMFISSPLKGIGLMPINCRVFLGKHKIILRKFSLSLQDTYQAPGYLIPEQGWQGFRLFRFGSFFAPAPAGNHILFYALIYISLENEQILCPWEYWLHSLDHCLSIITSPKKMQRTSSCLTVRFNSCDPVPTSDAGFGNPSFRCW